MRTLIFAFFLGIIALFLGLLIFGQIEEEKITFNRETWEKVNSYDKAWEVFKSQPLHVYLCGGGGFLAGGFAYLVFSITRRIRKKKAAKTTSKELPAIDILPKRNFNESGEKQPERLMAGRPLFCKILGLMTLGFCKFYAVPQGSALVVTTFGKYRKFCKPGLGCIWSLWGFYQRPYKNMPLIECKETTIPYEKETVVTSDGLRCKLDVMICYRIIDPGKALFEVDDYVRAIENVVRAVLRNECGRQSAQTLRTSRELITHNLQNVLEKDVAPWGIKVRLVKISNIDVSTQDRNGRFDPFENK